MRRDSYLKNTFLNAISGFGGEGLIYIVNIAVRTVFIKTLGAQYLGINGLLSNIMSMLSLAELGIHEAMNYRLYQPIKEKDYQRLRQWMIFYRRAYCVIGFAVLLLGLSCIPFLKYFIKDYQIFEQLGIKAWLVFILYLMQSVSSYWFAAYKTALVKASQKEYFINVATYVGTLLTGILQIVVLWTTENYLFYLTVIILINILQNLYNASFMEKLYPDLLKGEYEPISKEDYKNLVKDCVAISIFSLHAVVIKSTDNLILSSFIGLGIVGLYSNYLMIYNALKKVIKRLFRAAEASLGIAYSSYDDENKEKMFLTMNYCMLIIAGTFVVCVANLSDEFIINWIGKDYIIPQPFSFLIAMEMLLISFGLILEQMRNVMGLFQKMKYKPFVGIALNLFISIFLVRRIGIYGVLLGTILSELLSTFVMDPFVIYIWGFKNKKSLLRYYGKMALYLIEICFCIFLGDIISKHIFPDMGWVSWLIHASLCFTLTFTILIFINYRSFEYKTVRNVIERALQKRRK